MLNRVPGTPGHIVSRGARHRSYGGQRIASEKQLLRPGDEGKDGRRTGKGAEIHRYN